MGEVFIIVVIASAFVHIPFALAVYLDAKQLPQKGLEPAFVGRFIWGLATLLGGVFVAAVYWLIHHSTLRRSDDGEESESADE